MINKIKEIFGYKGTQKVIQTHPNDLNINTPVYTIVEKVKENPRRLEFLWVRSHIYTLVVIDKKTNLRFGLSVLSSGSVSILSCNKFNLTEDEEKYLVEQLQPIYKERQNRLTCLLDQRKLRADKKARVKLQLEWEK